jgi:hypothetical protein
MTPFDPIKAQREIINGLLDVQRVISTQAREAEMMLGEAESQFNALTKISRFIQGLLEDERAKLRQLEEATAAKGPPSS